MEYRKIYVSVALLCVVALTSAQEQKRPQKFSPEQFDAELQQFITKEAGLSQAEVAAFFPVYKEMQKKQRALMEHQRQLNKVKPADEKGCEQAIKKRDELELEQKRILQTYHKKFLSILSASKLYDVIKAEDRFHRQKLRNWSHGPKHADKK